MDEYIANETKFSLRLFGVCDFFSNYLNCIKTVTLIIPLRQTHESCLLQYTHIFSTYFLDNQTQYIPLTWQMHMLVCKKVN